MPGLVIGRSLHRDAHRRLFDAESDDLGHVVVTLHTNPAPSEQELAATRHAYTVGRALGPIDGVVPVLDLIPTGHDLALVSRAVPDAQRLSTQPAGELGIAELCQVGAAVATALGHLHRAGFVHCGLSPDSVLMDTDGRAHLIDLHLATDVEAELAPLLEPTQLGRSLTYASPEQTGRVNRPVDTRSDLYSLGIILFELLTGVPPFADVSPRALVHAHIARRPPSVADRRPGVPSLLVDLVDRLLSKDPEHRYRTASAVADDLLAIADDHRAGRTPDFTLGHSDIDARLRISDKLFGRDAELTALLEAFEHTARGERNVVFVSGYSGIGKSRLVNELQAPVAAADGWFASGKFDLYRRDLPYAAFIQAAGELVRQVLALPTDALDRISSSLREQLRGGAGALNELVPELELLIGEQEPPGQVAPSDAQRRLEAGIVTLIDVLASVEHPLVLFIDDLQWTDVASLRLLDLLFDSTAPDTALILVLAWRDNEVRPGHRAWNFVERHRDRAASLTLGPLELAPLADWVAASLHTERRTVKDLAQLTLDKTLGNPFFVRQFLRNLVDDGQLRVDETATWSWDTAAIVRRGVSDNVGDLVSRHVDRVHPEVKRTLQAASCIGPDFDLESVSTVLGGSLGTTIADATIAGLHDAMVAGLIVPRDESYRYATRDAIGINPRFAFLHDRIQEVAHESMDPALRAAAHLAVARLRIANAMSQPDRLDDVTVDIASHFVAGLDALTDDAARVDAADWLVQGAARARTVMATETARVFVEHADALLDAERWNTVPDIARRLHIEAADTAYIDGRFDDIERHAAEVLAHTTDPLQRMPIHNINIGIGVAQGRWSEATEYAIEVLAEEYGIDLPLRPSLTTVAVELAKMRLLLRSVAIDDLLALPPMDDELVDASMSLLMKTATNAYWASPNLVPLIGFTMVRQSYRHGNSGLSAYGYVLYGLVLSAVLFDAAGGDRYGRLAMDILDRYDARHLHGKTALVHHGFIRHAVEPMATCGRAVLDAYHEAHAAGDIENAAYCTMAGMYTAVVSGEPLPAISERLAPYVAALHASGHAQTIYGTSVWVQAVANLRDDHVNSELSGEHIDFEPRLAQLLVEEDGNAIPQGVCAAGFLAFLLDDEERAERHLGLLFTNMRNTPGQAYLMPCLGLYAVLLVRKQAAGDATTADRAKLVAITRLLSRRAKANPDDHQPFLDFIDAERAVAHGRSDVASRFLDAAESAAASGLTYLEGLALERAAAEHEKRGHSETARHLLSRAVAVWRRYGARARLVLLGLDGDQADALDSSLDVDTLLDTVAAVSRELEVDAVVNRVLQLAVENAGARRAMLSLVENGRLVERASAEFADDEGITVTTLEPADDQNGLDWPLRIRDYVARTGTDLVLADACVDTRFERDAYIRGHRVLSVLCAPLHRSGELVGVLYMENALGHDVFTDRDLAITRTIVGQAAIAVENASLYEQQRAMATAFGRFVPRPFLERLGRDSVLQIQLGDAVEEDVTILFSDLRDFTSLSETMSAAENFELLNDYLAQMDTPIQASGGFVDKFIGDAVMALFVDGADGAVAAAVGMTEALGRLNQQRSGRELHMGIGLHSGPVMLGTIGSPMRMDTTVIGDTVNTASRLEGLTKSYGAAVVVSDALLDRLRDPGQFSFREVGRVRAKGKQRSITVHEVLDARGADLAALESGRAAFETGLTAWYAGDFHRACEQFDEAIGHAPCDSLARRYLTQATELSAAPTPDGWDGIDVRVDK